MKTSATLLVLFLLTLYASAQTDKSSTDQNAKTNEASSAQSAVSPDSARLILTHMVEPVYPLEAMRQKLQGRVVIHLVVSTTGDVVSAEPVSGNPILIQAAVAAMKQWKFKPYIHDGHPVQIGYKMPYDFAMADRVFDNPTPTGNTDLTKGTNASPSASGTTSSGPAQISSGELQKFLVHQVAPVYPDMARQRMVQGTVALKAVIGTDGGIKDLKVISGPSELYESAMEAVQQWRYKPYTLDGKPVEVESTINVNYKLKN